MRVRNTRPKSTSLRALAWQTSCTKTAERLTSKINQAADFRARHSETRLLILPNAWDACSAMLMQRLGAEAIATTSAGVAWALGYPDGDAVPIDLHAACIRQIARVVSCPVSADVEGGYSDDPRQAAENILRLLDAGAVGINLEDGNGATLAIFLCMAILQFHGGTGSQRRASHEQLERLFCNRERTR